MKNADPPPHQLEESDLGSLETCPSVVPQCVGCPFFEQYCSNRAGTFVESSLQVWHGQGLGGRVRATKSNGRNHHVMSPNCMEIASAGIWGRLSSHTRP